MPSAPSNAGGNDPFFPVSFPKLGDGGDPMVMSDLKYPRCVAHLFPSEKRLVVVATIQDKPDWQDPFPHVAFLGEGE